MILEEDAAAFVVEADDEADHLAAERVDGGIGFGGRGRIGEIFR